MKGTVPYPNCPYCSGNGIVFVKTTIYELPKSTTTEPYTKKEALLEEKCVQCDGKGYIR